MARILIGTTSWTEATLVESGRFYPPEANSAEERLRYYASWCSVVKVDRPCQGSRPRGLVTSHDPALPVSLAMSLAGRTAKLATANPTAQSPLSGTPCGSAHLVPFPSLV
jgi:hypothetical protein